MLICPCPFVFSHYGLKVLQSAKVRGARQQIVIVSSIIIERTVLKTTFLNPIQEGGFSLILCASVCVYLYDFDDEKQVGVAFFN